ncbi:hypothetical protein [Actinomycetospora chibensis]|uniref:Tetratricopeptide repeat protein n=1 Tax=Actinomycetospora chibensis TaxID=663606 RepID=A0ABV9RH72_9PSEU|nr:hypothetical protein [Actinomycetospora chibensis]MDD7922855.1 hypothetical protein [Actinomycetospora chibensis]
MEVPAGQPGVPGLSASAILAVAEGLRWTDPQLSVALAEHVARVAGADASARTAAERSAVLALGQADRAPELIVRALPHLRAAEREGRIVDAGTLRCELSLAALRCGDADAAETLLEPLAAGRVLPPAVRVDALVAWAAARASRGDVAGVDAAGRQVDDLVGETADDARRLAIRRARAEARRHAGDISGALEVFRVAASDANVAGGGREAALLLADRVELLAGLGRLDEAREAGTPALTEAPRATTSLALGRLRCALARSVHLPAGEFEIAERLAREAETDLTARGHEAQVAVAVEVLAAVAEGRGDARQALEELRRARPHLDAAHEEVTRARAALAAALSRDEDRIPSAAGADSPDRATGEDADGAWATVATSGAGPGEIATDTPSPTVAEPVRSSTLDGLPTSSEPEEPDPVPGGDAPDDPPEPAPTPTPTPAAEAAAAPRRRRNRYREEGDPGDLLAAALAAARGEFVAFSTAPATAAPAATDTEPPDHGPAEPLTAGHLTAESLTGDAPSDQPRNDGAPSDEARNGGAPSDGAQDGDTPGGDDDPAAARRRRLARARARWEAPETILPRRDDVPSSSRSEVRRDDPLGSWDDEHGATGRPSGEDGTDPLGDRGHEDIGRGTTSPGDRDPLGLERPSTGARDADRERPGSPRRGALDIPDPTPVTARPGADHTGTNGQNARGVDSRSALDQGGATGLGAGPGGADDELARELALTLVDLISEYEDAGLPLGGGLPNGSPTSLNGSNGHATVTSSSAAGVRPAGRAATPRTATGITHATPSSATPSRNTGAQGSRNGVPSARREDDSGPRLADLLADAMDAYHSAGPGPDAADDRRARR